MDLAYDLQRRYGTFAASGYGAQGLYRFSQRVAERPLEQAWRIDACEQHRERPLIEISHNMQQHACITHNGRARTAEHSTHTARASCRL
jgi:hypothetical protein